MNYITLKPVSMNCWQWEVRCMETGDVLCSGREEDAISAASAANAWIERI